MIQGLVITPPILGRISIGRVVERNGKRLPEKDDQFTLTSQIQTPEGWLPHPLDEILRKAAPNGKLRSLPISLLFSDPDLNFRAEYTLFDRTTGRPTCAGDGIKCRRHTNEGMANLPCPSPQLCELGSGGRCKAFGRLNVRIGDDDELGTFIFRTTGYNSIRALMARLAYFEAVSGGLLACMPLELRLRGKSTTQSHRTPIYYVDITVREGMTLEEALAQAKATDQHRRETGFDQQALDAAARQGFGNGIFEESESESTEVIEEFYPEPDAITDADSEGGVLKSSDTNQAPVGSEPSTLAGKLDAKLSAGKEPSAN